MKKKFNEFKENLEKGAIRAYLEVSKHLGNNKGWGAAEVIGVAAVLIVAAFVTIPGLRSFASTVMTKVNSWWATISTSIFPTS